MLHIRATNDTYAVPLSQNSIALSFQWEFSNLIDSSNDLNLDEGEDLALKGKFPKGTAMASRIVLG